MKIGCGYWVISSCLLLRLIFVDFMLVLNFDWIWKFDYLMLLLDCLFVVLFVGVMFRLVFVGRRFLSDLRCFCVMFVLFRGVC